jgi:MFS family permease
MRSILPVLVISQFLCCSLWFTGNAILSDIGKDLHLSPTFLAHLTSSTQFGFITGTLIFAIFTLSDRFSPSHVFFCSAILAGVFNLAMCIPHINYSQILLSRILTGFFIAGIYPVGMKIASDYYKEGLGRSLGFLVGALVIGTALPHLLKNMTLNFPGNYIVYITTALSVLGGFCILLFVPDGPYRKPSQKLNFAAFMKGFKNQHFRFVSFGYFGHMWELYTFWAFLPIMLAAYNQHFPGAHLNVSLLSFLIIGSGGIACVLSGILSNYFGAKKIAFIALLLSCICCLLSPLFLFSNSTNILVSFLFVWGFAVIADSPLFSALVAKNAPEESRGTSLTIVNCIGFSITILSIQFINALSGIIESQYVYMLLAIGPVFGLFNLLRKNTSIT